MNEEILVTYETVEFNGPYTTFYGVKNWNASWKQYSVVFLKVKQIGSEIRQEDEVSVVSITVTEDYGLVVEVCSQKRP